MHLRKWNCPHCGGRNLKQPKRCERCNKLRSSKVRKKTTRKKVVKKKKSKAIKKTAPVAEVNSKLPPGSYTLRVDVAVNGKPTLVWVMKHQQRTHVTGEWRMVASLDNAFEEALRKGTQ